MLPVKRDIMVPRCDSQLENSRDRRPSRTSVSRSTYFLSPGNIVGRLDGRKDDRGYIGLNFELMEKNRCCSKTNTELEPRTYGSRVPFVVISNSRRLLRSTEIESKNGRDTARRNSFGMTGRRIEVDRRKTRGVSGRGNSFTIVCIQMIPLLCCEWKIKTRSVS